LAMLRRVVKRSERTRSENESASKQVFVRSREFGGAVRRKTNESCPRIEDLNDLTESEKRDMRGAKLAPPPATTPSTSRSQSSPTLLDIRNYDSTHGLDCPEDCEEQLNT
jgi:hypothetical protein